MSASTNRIPRGLTPLFADAELSRLGSRVALDRRSFLLAAASSLATASVQGKNIEENGLFWEVTPHGRPTSIVFGYARTAAAIAPAVVSDGEKFALGCGMLLADVPNYRLPAAPLHEDQTTPISNRVPPALAQRIRSFVAAGYPSMPRRDQINGLTLLLLLQFEGQTQPVPSVGGTIVEYAQKAGRSVGYLLDVKELAALFQPPDLGLIDKRVSADSVNYMMTLRDRIGPVGKYQESLYVNRRVGELARLTDEMKSHGVPMFADLSGVDENRLETMIIDRAIKAVLGASQPLFLMLPIGVLTLEDGMLAGAVRDDLAVRMLA
jgi:hypothetical protein